MKFLLLVVFIVALSKPSKADYSVCIISPDSIPDSILTAPASPELNGSSDKGVQTGVWKMYEAPARLSNSLQTKTNDKAELKDKLKRRKKVFACLLAFPVPFGIIGLHRIYLGTKPYVPLVYIATLGGAAGIVPFIDFIVLLLEKDIGKYQNNPNIIMWAN